MNQILTSDDAAFLSERLERFDPDDTLVRNFAEIRSLIADQAPRLAQWFRAELSRGWAKRARMPEDRIDDMVARFTAAMAYKFEPRWIAHVRDEVQAGALTDVPLGRFISGISGVYGVIHEMLCASLVDDPDRLGRLTLSLMRASLFETDVFCAQFDTLRKQVERDRRSSSSSAFNQELMSTVDVTAADSRRLRAKASDVSTAARGMLGKTAEVAAAAEESALAMREAAQTAAGLIRAIEDARNEVEVAAGVATRAGSQASEA
ncbi:MAG: chemotaxis protein, partial [Sphingomonadales bacterium]